MGALAIKAREVTNSLTLMIGMNVNVHSVIREINTAETSRGRNLFKEVESGLEPVRKFYGLCEGKQDGENGANSS